MHPEPPMVCPKRMGGLKPLQKKIEQIRTIFEITWDQTTFYFGVHFFEGPNPYTYLLFFTFCSWAPAFYYVFLGAAPYPVAPHGFHPGLSAFAMLFA